MVSIEKFIRVDQQWNVSEKSKCATEFNFKHLDKITSPIISAYTDSSQEETRCPQRVPNKDFSFPGFHTSTGSKRVSKNSGFSVKTSTIPPSTKWIPLPP